MDRIKYFFSELYGKHGLINDFFASFPQRDFVPRNIYNVVLSSRNLNYLGYCNSKLDAGSCGFSEKQALESALGEFIERLAGLTSIQLDTTYESYDSLKAKEFNAYHPEDFTEYANWQYTDNFPFKRWKRDDKVYWINGTDLLNNKTILIPTFLAYWSGIQPDGQMQKFMINNSTGCAAGKNIEDAIVSGVQERFERHAFSNFWFNQENTDFLTYSADTILNHYHNDSSILKLFTNKRVHFKIFDLKEFSKLETILAFIKFRYKNKIYFTVGCASRFDKRSAIIKACLEAYQGIDLPIHQENSIVWSDDYEEVIRGKLSLQDHAFFYNRFIHLRERVPILRHLFDEKYTCSEIRDTNNFDLQRFTVEDISKLGLKKIYYVDITPTYLELPYKVVNVIIPEFASLPTTFEYPFLGNVVNNTGNLFLSLPHFFP
jgi:ribosomal protein S12 methylthiotransferase accessory factor